VKTILVSGAAGYIGRHVVREILEQGHKVIANDIVDGEWDHGCTVCLEDIFSGKADVFNRLGKPDILIHLAWKDGFVHNSFAHMDNISSHFRFLSDMARGGCGNIAVMGSMHEVGYWEGKIDENTPCNPLSQYGVAKNALRQSMTLLAQEKGFNLYWLRGFYIYGDDCHGSSVFTKIIRAVNEGKCEFPFTSGKNKYDFISIDELARQIVSASTQEKITGIINVCTGTVLSLAERVEAFIKENGFNIKLSYGAFPDRVYDSPIIWGDNTRIGAIMNERNT
jgi:dTDP-6-deoxy-L-talose 4-dehydrogenase (NAD+)